MKKQIIAIVAVHPDDETLGCAGTILKYVLEKNFEAHWIICTEINKKHSTYLQNKYKNRDNEIEKVKKFLKFSKLHKLKLPSMMLNDIKKSKLVEKIYNKINNLKPSVLIIPFIGDVHSDHRTISDAIISSIKSFKTPYIQKILMMEVLSETEQNINPFIKKFDPNYFVDISKYIKNKTQAFKIYKSEVQKTNQPRNLINIKALSKVRGAQINTRYAEAFMVLRIKN